MNHSATKHPAAKHRKAKKTKEPGQGNHITELENELSNVLQEMRECAIHFIKKSLALVAADAPINEALSTSEAVEAIQEYLIDAPAVPVHLTICQALAKYLGFDAALITFGEFKGEKVGFIPGLPLLKFVGFLNFDAPTLQQAALLMAMDENDTKH